MGTYKHFKHPKQQKKHIVITIQKDLKYYITYIKWSWEVYVSIVANILFIILFIALIVLISCMVLLIWIWYFIMGYNILTRNEGKEYKIKLTKDLHYPCIESCSKYSIRIIYFYFLVIQTQDTCHQAIILTNS